MTFQDTYRHPFLESGHKQLFIGGEWVDAISGETFACIDPSRGTASIQVSRGGAADIDAAVAAARTAFKGEWSKFKAFDRQALMLKLADAIDARFEDLARLETIDMGAPIARTSMFRRWIQQTFRYYAAQAVADTGDVFNNSVPGNFMSYSHREPLGVVGAIIPWNGPLITQLWSICPVLASGCTLVLKPAEEAPLSTLMLAGIMHDAGLPAGVINVVPGPGATAGAALAAHTGVDKVNFTGSTATGRRIIEASATNMKRVALELGGKSPDIVFADADLDVAATGAAMACFNNTGQVCFAGTRLFVERSIYNDFVERVAAVGSKLKVGLPLDGESQLGPLASQAQLDRVQHYFEVARNEGARLVTGGERLGGNLADGFFVAPTVYADVDMGMAIAREEIFGPVLSAIPFDTEEEAIELANATEYGLGGGVWSRDVGRVHRVAHGIRTGMVWTNCYGVTDPGVTFAGTKHSGYGVKGGPHHLNEFMISKTVWLNLA
ncbi:aldehyde dehydrogenase family protein [Novosphingobium colocasiae]|uniref:Aldehyde dehydrogenase n=1 Tax=Novosphingobium colocasiae TaxID=1256513 RepID=A0A918PBK2_9SPHN|nr:aldehyde dehydrogenase family protein [Novosphingobium colocasiae]GGY98150.1 aldehyde dehydrogenase [Novosphingobium colocasiae]